MVNPVYKVLERQENLDYLVVETTIFATVGGIPDDFTPPDFHCP
ncbi:hypothetical protein [Microcoleus sp. S13C4]